ncbi:HD domain protein [uncultured archaeon]|nr:HD domain protein [uncultured archaeon]
MAALDPVLEEEFSKFMATAKRKGAELDQAGARKAFENAAMAHNLQKRLSGEPYVLHSLAVAEIVLDYLPDTAAIQAALLHDVPRDGGVPVEYIERDFGPTVGLIVDGLTKIGRIPFMSLEQAEAENIRKMMLILSKDVRIILIKLADRLQNMRTVSYLPREKQERMARETMEIYAPLAHKLNIARIKNELEDLSFSVLNPEEYGKLKAAMDQRRVGREGEIERIRGAIEKELKRRGMDVIVKGREKHLYSIYKKVKKKELDFGQIHDLFAVRVITRRVSDCYRVLEILGEMYHPIPGTLDDYISAPKPNMYQSLHINLLTEKGQNVEAQIRTEEMDRLAESGIAAHWRYKGHVQEEYDKKIEWMKSLLNWQREVKEESEYIEGLKIELFERGVVAFTPKGDMIELSEGSTALDFAFMLHTSIGLHADKIKVNGKIVQLSHPIGDGDVVEVTTSPNMKANTNWLTFVKGSKAKSKIRVALKMEGPKRKVTAETKVSHYEEEGPAGKAKLVDGALVVKHGMTNVRIAKCCNPTGHDEIVTYPPKMGNYTIHVKGCPTFKKSPEAKRAIPAEWVHEKGELIQKINVTGEDRPTLLSDILKVIIPSRLQIEKVSISMTKDEKVMITLVLRLHRKEDMEGIRETLKKVKSVKEVYFVAE